MDSMAESWADDWAANCECKSANANLIVVFIWALFCAVRSANANLNCSSRLKIGAVGVVGRGRGMPDGAVAEGTIGGTGGFMSIFVQK